MATEATRKPASRGGNFLLTLVLGAIISTVVFTVIGLLIPRTYTSNATLLFPGAHSTASTGASMGDAGASGGGSGGADQPSLPLMQGVLSVPQPGTSPSTAQLILSSRKVTLELIDEFKLSEAWNRSRQRTIERFNDRFVCSVGNSGDLHIAFRDFDRKRAIAITSAALDKLTAAITELSLDPAGKNVDVLKETLRQAETDCMDDQRALIEFQRAVGGASPDTQVQLLGQTYSEIQRILVNAEADANASAANVHKTAQLGEAMLKSSMNPGSSGNSLLGTLYQQAVDRESELQLLRQRFTDRHPDVVKAQGTLEVARAALKNEVNRQLGSLRSGASPLLSDATVAAFSSRAKLDGLRKASATTRRQLDSLSEAQVRYGELSTRLRDDRTRLTLVRAEFVKAQLIAQSRGPQFVVLDTPDAPTRPNEYETYYFTLFGLALGIVLVLVKELFGRIKAAMRNMGF